MCTIEALMQHSSVIYCLACFTAVVRVFYTPTLESSIYSQPISNGRSSTWKEVGSTVRLKQQHLQGKKPPKQQVSPLL